MNYKGHVIAVFTKPDAPWQPWTIVRKPKGLASLERWRGECVEEAKAWIDENEKEPRD